MKRSLLTAASALVLTAAASAQTLQLSGEVTTVISYDGGLNQFQSPQIGGGSDDGLFLTFSGNGAGWEYEVQNDLSQNTDWGFAEVKLSNDVLGSFKIEWHGIEWEREILGDALTAQVMLEVENIEEFEIVLFGTVGAIEYDLAARNDAMRSFGGDVLVPIMGVDVGLSLLGSLNDTSPGSLVYGLYLSTQLLGVETSVEIDEAGGIYIEGQTGPFSLSTSATDGDLFNDIRVAYSQDITEQMTANAEVNFDGASTSGMAALTLRF